MATPKEKVINLDEWDFEEPDDDALQEWHELVPDILHCIRSGVFDSYIRQIARTCFERRDAIEGKDPGWSKRQVTKRLAEKVTAQAALAGTQQVIGGADYDRAGTFVGKIDQSTAVVGSFTYNGKRFSKSDLAGKIVMLPNNMKPAYLARLRVELVGFQGKYVLAKFKDRPRRAGHWLDAYNSGKTVKLGYGCVEHILDLS